MNEKAPLQERHTFIPTYHLHKWSHPSKAELPTNATSLWLERGINDHLAKHPEEYLLGPTSTDIAQIEEASRRDLPIWIGDAPVVSGGTEDAALWCVETLTGIGALASTSRHTRSCVHALMSRMRRIFHAEQKQQESANSIALNRRLFMGALGTYLAIPAIERAVQLAAPSSTVAAATRKFNQKVHPEDCPITLHVRNAIHALKLEFTDRFFQDTHPCSMFGAFHSGIIDELGKTQEEKLKFLRDAGVGKISHPSPACWQIHGFSFDSRILRYRRTEIIPVGYLRDLFDTKGVNELD